MPNPPRGGAGGLSSSEPLSFFEAGPPKKVGIFVGAIASQCLTGISRWKSHTVCGPKRFAALSLAASWQRTSTGLMPTTHKLRISEVRQFTGAFTATWEETTTMNTLWFFE